MAKNNKNKNNFLIYLLILSIGFVFLSEYSGMDLNKALDLKPTEKTTSTDKKTEKKKTNSIIPQFSKSDEKEVKEITFSEFQKGISSKKIIEVLIEESAESNTSIATGTFKDGSKFKSEIIVYPEIIKIMELNNIKLSIKKEKKPFSFLDGFSIFTTILWIGILLFMVKMMRSGSKMGNFTKPKTKVETDPNNKVTFKDVAGADEAKQDVEEIIDFLKDPAKFNRLGGKIPKGVLLVGPPGTGKTLLAKAIAGEAKVPFFSMSGSDFVEMFVGVGASRVRNLFEEGKKNAPCIIFIDEIDAVGRHRGSGYGGGNDEREQTLNQLLVEMDGFATNNGVILVAATNRADVLDEALLRPGRFDRQIQVPLPDLKGRQAILDIHAKKVKMVEAIDLSSIAKGTPGFSGADLANLVNEAALYAARKNRLKISAEDFEYARDKILMGAERRSLTMDKKEIELTAYHEAGHAITSVKTAHSDPIHKATIIPRGGALGMVQSLPKGDRVSQSISDIKANIIMAMGGRVAEEIFFGKDKITSGASGDIRQATYYARNSVTKWGLNDKMGMVYYEEANLGYHAAGGRTNIADKTAEMLDQEVKKMIDEGYKKAKQIMTKYKKETKAIAEALLKYETLTGDEIQTIADGKKLKRKEPLKEIKRSSSLPITKTKKAKVVKKATSKKKKSK